MEAIIVLALRNIPLVEHCAIHRGVGCASRKWGAFIITDPERIKNRAGGAEERILVPFSERLSASRASRLSFLYHFTAIQPSSRLSFGEFVL